MNNQTSSPNFYANIPATVRYDEDLPLGARLLYGEISALCNSKGYCWATNQYFADLYNKSKGTISRWITALEQKNHIESQLKYKDGSKEVEGRYIQICTTPLSKMIIPPLKNDNTLPSKTTIPSPQKRQYPPLKNDKDNTTLNTTINNTINNTIKENVENEFSQPSNEGMNVKIDLKNFALKDPSEKKSNPLMAAEISKEVKEIVDYFNDATGKNCGYDTISVKHIKARLKDGATIDQCKNVIDSKSKEWIDDDKMKRYLRFETLFNKTKFSTYVEEAKECEKTKLAIQRMIDVVDDFCRENELLLAWDIYELKSLQEVGKKLKTLLISRGEMTTMTTLCEALAALLQSLTDKQLEKFSMNYINFNFNSIANGATKPNKDREWKQFVKRTENHKFGFDI